MSTRSYGENIARTAGEGNRRRKEGETMRKLYYLIANNDQGEKLIIFRRWAGGDPKSEAFTESECEILEGLLSNQFFLHRVLVQGNSMPCIYDSGGSPDWSGEIDVPWGWVCWCRQWFDELVSVYRRVN